MAFIKKEAIHQTLNWEKMKMAIANMTEKEFLDFLEIISNTNSDNGYVKIPIEEMDRFSRAVYAFRYWSEKKLDEKEDI